MSSGTPHGEISDYANLIKYGERQEADRRKKIIFIVVVILLIVALAGMIACAIAFGIKWQNNSCPNCSTASTTTSTSTGATESTTTTTAATGGPSTPSRSTITGLTSTPNSPASTKSGPSSETSSPISTVSSPPASRSSPLSTTTRVRSTPKSVSSSTGKPITDVCRTYNMTYVTNGTISFDGYPNRTSLCHATWNIPIKEFSYFTFTFTLVNLKAVITCPGKSSFIETNVCQSAGSCSPAFSESPIKYCTKDDLTSCAPILMKPDSYFQFLFQSDPSNPGIDKQNDSFSFDYRIGNCGGNFSSSPGGTIMSPLYGYYSPSSCDCNWYIYPTDQHNILIAINAININTLAGATNKLTISRCQDKNNCQVYKDIHHRNDTAASFTLTMAGFNYARLEYNMAKPPVQLNASIPIGFTLNYYSNPIPDRL